MRRRSLNSETQPLATSDGSWIEPSGHLRISSISGLAEQGYGSCGTALRGGEPPAGRRAPETFAHNVSLASI